MRFFDEPLSEQETAELIENFDHNSPLFRKNPYEAYRMLRDRCPVAHTNAQGGFWIPTTFEAVSGVARNDVDFSSKTNTIPQHPETFLPPISFDPPESTEYRRMITPLLSPAAVKLMEPRIQKLAKDAVDGFIARGEADLVQDFARHVTYKNIITITGLPPENTNEIMSVVAGGVLGTISPEEYMQGLAYVHEEASAAIERHRREPVQGTAITHLVHNVTIFGGRKPTDREIEGSVMLMLGGGADTTVATTGTALLYLSEHPDVRQKLIDNPDLWDTAMEEFLRYTSANHALARIVANDCKIADMPIHKGERVLLPWAAGNWDANEFPEPDQVKLDRFPNRHIAFGVGTHRCLGSHLARTMLSVMLREVLARLPDYKIRRDGVRKSPNASVVMAFVNLPATFTPGN